MPMESAIAPANVSPPFPETYPAKTTPIAIPSGILWRVTTRTTIVVFFSRDLIPSGSSLDVGAG